MRKTLAMLIGATMLAMATPASAQAPTYPDKPIRIVVPFPVGGIADTFGREIGRKLTDAWGQPVLIDNRTGAGGNIGADIVAKSPPDGYTLLMFVDGNSMMPAAIKGLQHDPVKSFAQITLLGRGSLVLVAHPSFPASTVKQLIDIAKAKPNAITYAAQSEYRR